MRVQGKSKNNMNQTKMYVIQYIYTIISILYLLGMLFDLFKKYCDSN